MISTKVQRIPPRGHGTCWNPNFALFALIFFDIFLILYHLNRKHSNFHLNWTEGVAYRNYTIFSTKFQRASWLWVRCHRSWIWASSHGQTRLRRHIRSQRKKHHHTIGMKGRWNSPRGQNTSRKPNFALFGRIFLIFFLILYHLNRKRTIFQLNWTEGVAYRNFTIFSTKFEAPSQLWVRWLRSWISESSRGQIRLGRHNRSQRNKHHNMISTKAHRSSRQGQTTSRNPKFARFALSFWYFLWFCIT
jgi:hypothetical protein